MAWDEKPAMQEYLRGLTENSKLLEISWRAALQRYFDETMYEPATVASYLAYPCARTDLQVRLARCLMGIKKS